MNLVYALFPVIAFILIVYGGVGWLDWQFLFGVIIPYAAIVIFIIGFIYRIWKWARAPVPFHIPTVAGQHKSLPWIKSNSIESPSSTIGVIIRMTMEVLLFRSLFRNEKAELKDSKRISFQGKRWLWLGGLVFHWSLLIIIFRHICL